MDILGPLSFGETLRRRAHRCDALFSLAQLSEYAEALRRLACAHSEWLPRAEETLNVALDKHEASLGPSHPAITGLRHNLGDVLVRLGRYAEAESVLLAAEGGHRAGSDALFNDACRVRESLAELYNVWDAAEPDRGYDVKAAEWRRTLVSAD